MNQTQSHFDQRAAQWDSADKIAGSIRVADKIKAALNRNIPEFQWNFILEIGCGTGLLGQQFLNESTQYLGVDSSQEMLKVLKAKLPSNQVQVSHLDIEAENLVDHSFNFVISQMAFHHLRNPSQVLKKLNTQGKKIFALVDLDQEDGSFHPDPQGQGVHHFGFSKETIQSWGLKSGLKLLHHEIIDAKKKNQKEYSVFLALFSN